MNEQQHIVIHTYIHGIAALSERAKGEFFGISEIVRSVVKPLTTARWSKLPMESVYTHTYTPPYKHCIHYYRHTYTGSAIHAIEPKTHNHTKQTTRSKEAILKRKVKQEKNENKQNIHTLKINTIKQYLKQTQPNHIILKQTTSSHTNEYQKIKNQTKPKQHFKPRSQNYRLGRPGWSASVYSSGWAQRCHTIPELDTSLIWTQGRVQQHHIFSESHGGVGAKAPHHLPENIRALPNGAEMELLDTQEQFHTFQTGTNNRTQTTHTEKRHNKEQTKGTTETQQQAEQEQRNTNDQKRAERTAQNQLQGTDTTQTKPPQTTTNIIHLPRWGGSATVPLAPVETKRRSQPTSEARNAKRGLRSTRKTEMRREQRSFKRRQRRRKKRQEVSWKNTPNKDEKQNGRKPRNQQTPPKTCNITPNIT